MKISTPGLRPSTPLTTETEKDYMKRVRGVTTLWPWHPFPRPAQRHTQRVPPGSQFLLWNKREPGWRHPASPAWWDTFWETHLSFYFTKITEESAELEHWVQIDMKKGDGTLGNQQSVLGRLFLLALSPKQRSKPISTPMCRAESLAPSGQGVQLAVLLDLAPQPIGHRSSWACPTTHPGKEPS